MNKELEDVVSSIKSKLQALTSNKKGDSGTVLIIGGSRLYTGAPYFVSLAAFYTGCELVYVFSEEESIIPLKILLPESIVCGIEYQEWLLEKVSACVIGPGLGRPSEETQEEIRKILLHLSRRNVPVVVDGDGIRLAEKLGIENFGTVIITPNINERKHVEKIEKRFFYVLKGSTDVILWSGREIKIEDEGCPKRIGGQGDILAGTIASLVSKCKAPAMEIDVLGSILLGCMMVRKAGRLAYQKYKRGLITRDILEELKTIFKIEFE
ncbi:putative sugar kinase [Encephalitozoon intestinalis ATCC 50506]|uniref:ATP-dependent (S)-NAD(P)H-hydrate dehydratase n=1 Tax=Encephalitozoon intestinalis (strain ATCC 50506) TaxID=876142 RepID=E0S6D6_ENCIT|nr:putative sugar kinase [Encephalitozoon intestinalis ATCC 50506]ADM11271.1 putative sugar kinase [Encephalitozoon intestinalis ATCC 50506]UTX44939.1 ADP-dependent (S)-NAD(P)H-hydrate dehydratase [Encephalitozoon intestinalis]